MSLPVTPPTSGIVTFLFTDIEGSTKLWKDFPEAMRHYLTQHDQLVRNNIEENHGYVFKTVGDAFCAAFHDIPTALKVAMRIQRDLARTSWGEIGSLKVRVAVHTGEAEERDGDYYGMTLSRISRLVSAGHGGQILISETVQQHLNFAEAPEGIALLDKGIHKLKDMPVQERIYQLVHPDLPLEFPELRTRKPSQLPAAVTSFIGREKEVAELKRLLKESRIVTVLGMGGAGKSRITQKVATDIANEYEYADGVTLVELAPISDPSLVPQTIASALKIREVVGHNALQTLIDTLRPMHRLILLDNCEHLLEASARAAEAIISVCPDVTILATSRETLGIAGEVTFPLPPLSVPDPNRLPPLEKLLQFEAVNLFVDRAKTAAPNFAISPNNASAVAQVCARLDGMPLAIQLAAARVKAMPVEQIARRLDDRFRILTSGSRTALPHQQTLRALVDWSYDLLESREKLLLSRLSAFSGGWQLEFAETVCVLSESNDGGDGEIEDWEILDILANLVNKSLIVYEEQDGIARYRFLETILFYGQEKLRDSGEEQTIRGQHAEFFLNYGRERLVQLRTPGEAVALRELERELNNLRSAMAWARAANLLSLYAELALVIGITFQRLGYQVEAVTPIQEALNVLNLVSGESLNLHAHLLRERAGLHLDMEETAEARIRIQEALILFQQLNDLRGKAHTTHLLGQTAMSERTFAEARGYFTQALEEFERVGDLVEAAKVHNNLGILERRDTEGSLEQAMFHQSEALRLCRTLGDQRGVAEALNNLGVLAQEQNNQREAWSRFFDALQIGKELGDSRGIAISCYNLGEVSEELGSDESNVRAVYLFAASEHLFRLLKISYETYATDALTRVSTKLQISEERLAQLREEAQAKTVDELVEWATR